MLLISKGWRYILKVMIEMKKETPQDRYAAKYKKQYLCRALRHEQDIIDRKLEIIVKLNLATLSS